MGYTHYWKLLSIPQKEIIQILLKTQIPKILQVTSTIKIQKDYDDPEPPIFNEKLIRFNGANQDGHQAFSIDFTKRFQFDCCKTNRKPYDHVVCLVLVCLANNIKDFSFSSDGGREQWQPIIEEYEEKINLVKLFNPSSLYSSD